MFSYLKKCQESFALTNQHTLTHTRVRGCCSTIAAEVSESESDVNEGHLDISMHSKQESENKAIFRLSPNRLNKTSQAVQLDK